MVKGSTLSLEIFSGDDGFDSLSEFVFFRMAQYVKECLQVLYTVRDFSICQSHYLIKEEFFQFLTFELRCNEHTVPYRQCRAMSTF